MANPKLRGSSPDDRPIAYPPDPVSAVNITVRQLMKAEFIEVEPRKGLIIGSSMLVAGLLIVAWKYQRIAEEVSSLQWPAAVGVVETANFHTSTTRSASNTTITTHHGSFSYRYSVNNTEYIGHRYDAKGNMVTGLEGESAEARTEIAKGATVEVFFDPDHPSRSVLKNGISEDTWVRATFSSFLLLVGFVVVTYQWKRLKSVSSQLQASGA